MMFLFRGLFRNAIRDMVVRGAPAIAIAAALALAVEVSGLEDFTGTPAEAAAFVSEKLEYLVSRYPKLTISLCAIIWS
jgi:methylthioribose-1-phosphate isomerase